MLNFDPFTVLTFDCYGTLIDWETGIWNALQPIFAAHGVTLSQDSALELFGALESELEAGPYIDYKTVLAKALEGFGARQHFTPSADELDQFAHSVKDWPAFPDTVQALKILHQCFKLAIVSNIDDDLFAYTAPKLQESFDWVITASQVKSYKPALPHFYTAFERIGLPRTQILHTAQSLFHDIVTAKSLGLSTVWVNRRHAKGGWGATPQVEAVPDLEVPDLISLARLTERK